MCQGRVPYKWLSPEALLWGQSIIIVIIIIIIIVITTLMIILVTFYVPGPGTLQVAKPRGLVMGAVQQQE